MFNQRQQIDKTVHTAILWKFNLSHLSKKDNPWRSYSQHKRQNWSRYGYG